MKTPVLVPLVFAVALSFGAVATASATSQSTRTVSAVVSVPVGTTYTIKKGDTLWAIAGHFLKKPWLWPQIWHKNLYIKDPHWIYPGEVLQLGSDGYLHVVSSIQPETNLSPIPALPLTSIKPFLKDFRLLDFSELQQAPKIAAVADERPFAVTGMNIYAKGLSAMTPGTLLVIARPTHKYQVYSGNGGVGVKVAQYTQGSYEVPSPELTWTSYGYTPKQDLKGQVEEVKIVGTAEVTEAGNTTVLQVRDSSHEVLVGDYLLPYKAAPWTADFYPKAVSMLPEGSAIVSINNGFDAESLEGTDAIATLDVGSNDGIGPGDVMTIQTKGYETADHSVPRTGVHQAQILVPGHKVGHLMVFQSKPHLSYALIMDSEGAVESGDVIVPPQQ